MKKVFMLMMAVLLMFTLAACSNQQEPEEPQYVDQNFIADLGKTLEKRFKSADEFDETADSLSDTEYGQGLSELIDIEIDALSSYRNGLFEDNKLQEYVINYLNVLEESKDALVDIGVDYFGAIDNYNSAYNERSKLLTIFVNDYNLTVGEKYTADLEGLLNRGQSVIESENAATEVETMLNNLKFEVVEDEDLGDWKTYRAILENTSEYEISYVSYTIDLLDSKGVVVEQNYAGADNVTPGKKYNIEFSTDAEFDTYELTVDYMLA